MAISRFLPLNFEVIIYHSQDNFLDLSQGISFFVNFFGFFRHLGVPMRHSWNSQRSGGNKQGFPAWGSAKPLLLGLLLLFFLGAGPTRRTPPDLSALCPDITFTHNQPSFINI